MSRTRYKAVTFTLFVPETITADNISEDELKQRLENPGYFHDIDETVKDLQTLVKRFPAMKDAIRLRVLNKDYFDGKIHEANDLYTLVELFPENRNQIYDLALIKGFKYYAANSLDCYSESPLELIFLAFPGRSDAIMEDFNTRCHESCRPKDVIKDSSGDESSDTDEYDSGYRY